MVAEVCISSVISVTSRRQRWLCTFTSDPKGQSFRRWSTGLSSRREVRETPRNKDVAAAVGPCSLHPGACPQLSATIFGPTSSGDRNAKRNQTVRERSQKPDIERRARHTNRTQPRPRACRQPITAESRCGVVGHNNWSYPRPRSGVVAARAQGGSQRMPVPGHPTRHDPSTTLGIRFTSRFARGPACVRCARKPPSAPSLARSRGRAAAHSASPSSPSRPITSTSSSRQTPRRR